METVNPFNPQSPSRRWSDRAVELFLVNCAEKYDRMVERAKTLARKEDVEMLVVKPVKDYCQLPNAKAANVWAALLEEVQGIVAQRFDEYTIDLSPIERAGEYADRMHGRSSLPAERTETAAPLATLPDGRYTVVLRTGDHVTLWIKPWRSRPGLRVISALVGPDNESDYEGFGQINPNGTYSYWRRFTNGYADWKSAVAFLALSDAEKQAQAREQYALASGRCAICGRTLTVPASIYRGVGPECASRLGLT